MSEEEKQLVVLGALISVIGAVVVLSAAHAVWSYFKPRPPTLADRFDKQWGDKEDTV